MQLKLNEPADWPGGKGVFRVVAGNRGGSAVLRHVEVWPNGNRVNKGVVAQVEIPGEHTITLSPGEVFFDACDAMGHPVACEAFFDPVPPAEKKLTLADRVKALENTR